MSESKISAPVAFFVEERFVIGIAAASALIVAACISGLPSASCAALVETYGRAISFFGATAFGALLTLTYQLIARWRISILEDMSQNFPSSRSIRLLIYGYLVIGYVSLAMTIYLFVASSFAGFDNLFIATRHCSIGSDTEVASRAHQQIRLYGIFDWFKYNPSGH